MHRDWTEGKELVAEVQYENDLPIGIAKSWYGKNAVREIVHFAQGKRSGKDEEFYENGQIKASSSYKDDLLDGEMKTWYEDGSLCTVKYYHEGIPIKEHKEYYPKESLSDAKASLQVMRHFKYNDEGQFEGEQKTYHPSGALHTSIAYQNGELHGIKAMWDQEGNLTEEARYEKGKLNGRFFEKLRDGKEQVFHYKDNRREGPHEIYFPPHDFFGKVKALEVNFIQDLAEGDAIEYNEEGNKVAATPYVKGKKEGTAKLFSAKGALLMTIQFHEDNREGATVQYFVDGKVHVEGRYANDLKDGEEKTYFPSGKLAKIIPYKNGQIHGLYQEWNDQDILVFEGEYKDGQRHGKFNKFYGDGKPALLQTFAEDQLHGIKKKYDPDGKLFESKYDNGKKI